MRIKKSNTLRANKTMNETVRILKLHYIIKQVNLIFFIQNKKKYIHTNKYLRNIKQLFQDLDRRFLNYARC